MWRAARCLRPCDRLRSSSSVILPHLRIGRNEMIDRYHCSLPAEVKADSMESCKVPKAL